MCTEKVADYYIECEWKPFRVFLPDFHEWCKANAGIQYCGLTAGCLDMDIEETFWSTLMRSGKGKNVLRIYFINNPGFEVEESIDAKWNSLTKETEEEKWKLYYISLYKAYEIVPTTKQS